MGGMRGAPSSAHPERGREAAGSKDDPFEGGRLGPYAIQRLLGEGHMGRVYAARDDRSGEAVALKILSAEHSKDRETVERFARAAKIAARLAIPHIVAAYEVGRVGHTRYLAMELMEGGNASARVRERGPFKEAEALAVARAMALALEGVERARLIHRDIKPENILFTRDDVSKLADLGLAKETTTGGLLKSDLTGTGFIVGTPQYMAPEQALGKRDLDIRTDIYGLGISLFEMVTGRLPFDGVAPIDVLTRQLHEPLPDPRILAPDLGDGAAAVIQRMTRKTRTDRFQSPGELREAVERLLEAARGDARDGRGDA